MKNLMNERFSCRKFTSKKFSDTLISEILEVARLSPSSLGLEPWKLVAVKSQNELKKLAQICNAQTHVEACSHAVVVVARTDLTTKDAFMQKNIARKGEWLKSWCEAKFSKMNTNELKTYALCQCYMFVANLVNVAKSFGVDSCIIGGFDEKRLFEWLGASENFVPALVVALGESEERGGEKVRFCLNELVEWR